MTTRSLSQADPAVHSIDHFALEVPDLADAERFYTAFGLEVTRHGNEIALRTHGQDHVWARAVQGRAKRLAYVCFNCYEQAFPALRAKIAGTCAAPAYVSPRYSDGVWAFDGDRNLVQVRVGPKTMPDSPSVQSGLSGKVAGERGVSAGRQQSAQVRPRRLSHVLLFTPDVDAQVRFYKDVLGLRLSDRAGDIIAFLHAVHGSDHHLMAFAKSSAPGWHHSSWDVAGVEEVGLGWMQMQAAGYTKGWGLGRHVLGSNYFCYVRDPWGSFCEYSSDIDFVPAGQQWAAGDHPAEDALYLWGPPPPAEFTTNTEA